MLPSESILFFITSIVISLFSTIDEDDLIYDNASLCSSDDRLSPYFALSTTQGSPTSENSSFISWCRSYSHFLPLPTLYLNGIDPLTLPEDEFASSPPPQNKRKKYDLHTSNVRQSKLHG